MTTRNIANGKEADAVEWPRSALAHHDHVPEGSDFHPNGGRNVLRRVYLDVELYLASGGAR